MSRPAALEDLDTDLAWEQQAMAALEKLARTGWVFEAYDLHIIGVPEPRSANMWGPLFKRAHMDGLIRKAAFDGAGRPSRRGGANYRWIGTES